MKELKSLPIDRLFELHLRLYEAVEIRGKATQEEMQLYFRSRYELEDRGWMQLPGNPHFGSPFFEREDAA